MIYIYTEQFFLWARIKKTIKILLKKQIRGPQAVEGSIIRGLKELDIPFTLNKTPKDLGGTACVISGGPRMLRWAIKQKQQGAFKYIVAGPIIVITPDEDDWIVASPEVNVFVVPSQWVKNWWVSFRADLADKIKLWPAGVRDFGDLGKDNGEVIVFQKNAPNQIFNAVISELKKRNLRYQIIRYGSYTHEEYFDALSKSRFMIYLSESESQGIALFEAWMANVPTLVWNRGYLINGKNRWDDVAISAPFLTEKLGIFFKSADDFSSRLDEFVNNYNVFSPRKTALENFSDTQTTKIYLDIIKSL